MCSKECVPCNNSGHIVARAANGGRTYETLAKCVDLKWLQCRSPVPQPRCNAGQSLRWFCRTLRMPTLYVSRRSREQPTHFCVFSSRLQWAVWHCLQPTPARSRGDGDDFVWQYASRAHLESRIECRYGLFIQRSAMHTSAGARQPRCRLSSSIK